MFLYVYMYLFGCICLRNCYVNKRFREKNYDVIIEKFPKNI